MLLKLNKLNIMSKLTLLLEFNSILFFNLMTNKTPLQNQDHKETAVL